MILIYEKSDNGKYISSQVQYKEFFELFTREYNKSKIQYNNKLRMNKLEKLKIYDKK